MIKSTLIVLTFFFGAPYLLLGQKIIVTIPWSQSTEYILNEKPVKIPTIQNHVPDNGVPSYHFLERVKSIGFVPTLSGFQTVLATTDDIMYLETMGIALPTSFDPSMKVTKAGEDAYLSIFIQPFYKKGNQILKITELSVSLEPKANLPKEKDFALTSALAPGSGAWYKVAVTADGIYKIDKSFLNSMGIQTSGLNPKHIHVFGNGEGCLPELNSAPYTDDLAENAIEIIGGNDNSFDDNDYILFYAYGPHKWYPSGTTGFEQRRNPYSDQSFYFINIDAAKNPLTIQSVDLSSGTEQIVFNSYDYRDLHEADLVSLVGGGKRWYGELFDVELTKSFQFSIPNLDQTQSVRYKVSLASNSQLAAGTSQKYYSNGSLLYQSTLPVSPYDFNKSISNFTDPNPTSNDISFLVSITRNSPNTLTYLDRILLNCRRNLVFYASQFGFRNLTQQDTTKIAKYQISNFPTSGFVWDLSTPHQPKKIITNNNGLTCEFWTKEVYTEFVASNNLTFYTPTFIGSVTPQNLHALPQVDYLIITHPDFISQAERLADLHRNQGLEVHVVRTDKIFNEFSSGAQDPVAIRKFAKMFYDRANQNGTKMLKYMCLFGDGTYDPKGRVANNNNYVLTYQVDESENHISAMVTDDFYGMLDDDEAIYDSDLLDIGIGRLLVSDQTQARQQVDKIAHYMMNGSDLFSSSVGNCCLDDTLKSTFGDWRTKVTQVADDEENGYFIKNDTEPQYALMKTNHREMNCDKIYLDAYPQQTSAGGQRYPDALDAISDRVKRGTLVLNYVGHGGEVGLAEERVVTIPQIKSWENINALTLFVSATCEFTKFDDPSRVSAGEWAALNPTGAAIALMTTTRSVFFGVNSSVGNAFFNSVFQRDNQNLPKTFGEIVQNTKNSAQASDNKRSFTLIGDPALRLALPSYNVVTDSINGQPMVFQDTLNALRKVTVKGHVTDFNNQPLTGFNGTVVPSVFDKIKNNLTLSQDPGSPVINFELQRNVIYKGKASVVNGYFEFSFIVPKDIALNYGLGKLSYYAFSNSIDAIGVDTSFYIGGLNPNGIVDSVGPELQVYLNDENFVMGGNTDENPVLFLKIFDENGVNTVGNGIGHDLTAILDGKTSDPILLNDYYVSDLNTYQSGSVKYPFSGLSAGAHTLKVKIWDVNNNPSDAQINFHVQEEATPSIKRLINYPNPFTTHTEFMIEHNQSCDNLDVQIQIYTISGRLVKTISENVLTKGFTIRGISWDGRDEFGDALAKGVYIYHFEYRTSDGKKAEGTEKLVILK